MFLVKVFLKGSPSVSNMDEYPYEKFLEAVEAFKNLKGFWKKEAQKMKKYNNYFFIEVSIFVKGEEDFFLDGEVFNNNPY